jgi:hypothetical protein
MKNLSLILFITITLGACDTATKKETDTVSTNTKLNNNPTAQKIAKKYGYDAWTKVNTIQFTFNVQRGGNTFSRSWDWNTKTNDVILKTKTDTLTFNHKKPDSLQVKADQAFINDKFWLLAPFNLVTDTGVTFSEQAVAIAPISKDTLSLLTVTYSNNGGYTPGDGYDFYYDQNYLIKEWSYRKSNAKEPSLSTTWENNKTINGVTFSTMHADSTGTFKLFFSDITLH